MSVVLSGPWMAVADAESWLTRRDGQDTDVFKRLDKDARKTARKVCIAAILHTDNAAVLHGDCM